MTSAAGERSLSTVMVFPILRSFQVQRKCSDEMSTSRFAMLGISVSRSCAGCGFSNMHLHTEQSRRNDGDAVLAPIRLFAGGDDHRVDQRVAELPGEPIQMADVIAADVTCQLELDREDAPVFPLDDEVDLVFPSTRSQMKDPRLRCLGVHAQRQGAEGLKQGTEQRPVPRNRRTNLSPG